MKKLILASGSPRRKYLLKTLGVNYSAIKSNFSEQVHQNQLPLKQVKENALGKAQEAARRYRNALIIGADTVVVYKGMLIGKPENRSDAVRILKMLQGKIHMVYTGLAVIDTENGVVLTDVAKTMVTMRELNNREIQAYLSQINPLDKAGAYAIQGAGALIIKRISGCYYNVVGFPLATLEDILLRLGVSLFDYMSSDNKRAKWLI